ncbi:MAG: hypothetical protein AAB545_02700 [Patescibacteria group bacterium]
MQQRRPSPKEKLARLILKHAFKFSPEGDDGFHQERPYHLKTQGLMTGHTLSFLAEVFVKTICSEFETINKNKAYAPRSPRQDQLGFEVLFGCEVENIPLLGALSVALFNLKGYNRPIIFMCGGLSGLCEELGGLSVIDQRRTNDLSPVTKRALIITQTVDYSPTCKAIDWAQSCGWEVAGVVGVLDYEERFSKEALLTITQEIEQEYKIRVVSLLGFQFLMDQFTIPPEGFDERVLQSLKEFRKEYGILASA